MPIDCCSLDVQAIGPEDMKKIFPEVDMIFDKSPSKIGIGITN